MNHFNPIVEAQPTCGRAWFTAARRLYEQGPTYGLVLHIENPIGLDADEPILDAVDRFLVERGHQGIQTVANTIFPATLYGGEASEVFARYERAYPRIKRAGGGWGHYFRRLTHWPVGDPRANDPKAPSVNQLETVIDVLQKHGPSANGSTWKQAYTLSTFDPRLDMTRFRGRQCLTMVELKPENDGKLFHMTATYRNHFYTTKALGNFVGLGRLLAFIAQQADLNVGTLTIHSTHASLETDAPDPKKGRDGWRKSDLIELIDRCGAAIKGAGTSDPEPRPIGGTVPISDA